MSLGTVQNVSLINALRPFGGSEFMMPTDDRSTSHTGSLDDNVAAHLVSGGVRCLEVYVDGRFYRAFEVDPEGVDIAINLADWVHWVERQGGPTNRKSHSSYEKGISLARIIADHNVAVRLAQAQEDNVADHNVAVRLAQAQADNVADHNAAVRLAQTTDQHRMRQIADDRKLAQSFAGLP